MLDGYHNFYMDPSSTPADCSDVNMDTSNESTACSASEGRSLSSRPAGRLVSLALMCCPIAVAKSALHGGGVLDHRCGVRGVDHAVAVRYVLDRPLAV